MPNIIPIGWPDGLSWDDIKEDVADRIIEYIAQVMPNLPELIVGRQMLSTLDLETIYGLTESDIFHGRLDWISFLACVHIPGRHSIEHLFKTFTCAAPAPIPAAA